MLAQGLGRAGESDTEVGVAGRGGWEGENKK